MYTRLPPLFLDKFSIA